MAIQPVFRFAPSPNGHLHLGHAWSALLNAHLARRLGGRFLVRMEDIDTTRCTDALVRECLEDLDWLGLAWEAPVLRQSREFPRYRAVAESLAGQGLIYPCFCSRSEIAAAAGANPPRDPDGAILYPGTCRTLDPAVAAGRIAAGEAHALRLDMRRALDRLEGVPPGWREAQGPQLETVNIVAANPAAWGDVVLVRKETPTSYHLSVVLDDALQGVTHVVRGADLLAATSVHRLLQQLLGLPGPIYHHHALLTDSGGRKLAKSAMSTPLRQMRREGATPEAIRAMLPAFD